VEQQRVRLKLVHARDAKVVDQPAQAGADVGAVGRCRSGRQVGHVSVEDFAQRSWLRSHLVKIDSEDGQDLAGGGEG
jgi:hypothetical protein